MSTSATSTQKIADDVLVDLALQGGGAHGAFTWGVLDRLLEEPRLGIDGISGTSAGAMNAVVLADGYTDGGAKGARRALEAFWAGVRLLAGGQHSVERKVVLEDFERRRKLLGFASRTANDCLCRVGPCHSVCLEQAVRCTVTARPSVLAESRSRSQLRS